MTEADLGSHQGLVRCGRCREVFNASWNFVGSLPDEAPADGQSGPSGQTMELTDAPVATEEIDLQDVAMEYDWDTDDLGVDSSSGQSEDEGQVREDPEETIVLADPEPLRPLDAMQNPEPGDRAKAGGSLSADNQEERVVDDELEGGSPDARSEPRIPRPEDIAEEIVIEAPVNLWQFNNDTDIGEFAHDQMSGPGPGTAKIPGLSRLQKKGATAQSGESPAPKPRKITMSHKASDVKLVEIPHPKPLKSIAWAAATIFLVLTALWQIKTNYLSDLAKITSLRPQLITFCEYAACTVPARTDIKSIDLISTSVDPHPDTPGALRVSANLINRARFAQRFPPLEVTLTDKEGEVVGRRTYLPHEYLSGEPGAMQSNVVQRADLDLAQPAQTAVGYEIQLVAR